MAYTGNCLIILSFVVYYTRFIKGYSSLYRPLYNLTEKVVKKTCVDLGENQGEAYKAYNALREAFTSAPVLEYTDYSLPFILHTDSSTDGLGAVLYQQQRETKDIRVIADQCY